MLDSFFSKIEFRPLKVGLNSNFVYIFVEKLKQLAFDVWETKIFHFDSVHQYTTRARGAVQDEK